MVRGRCLSSACVLWLVLCLCQRGAVQNAHPLGNPLGMESGAIPDSSLTASSEWSWVCGPGRARLNIVAEGGYVGAWCIKRLTGPLWIQVDLLTAYRISGVATQGRQDSEQWVTSFKIACSMNGTTFENVKDALTQVDKVFIGNSDRNTVVYNTLPVARECRYVRLLPIDYHGWISLRMELYEENPITGLNITLLYGDAPGEGFVLKDDGSSRGLLCAYSWDLKSAEVACRTLGFIGVESFTQRFIPFFSFDPTSVHVLRDGYNCTGTEATLEQCTPVGHTSSCNIAAGVVCTNTIVRLSGFGFRHRGWVQVYSETTNWGFLCYDYAWVSRNTRVVCRMLGYLGSKSQTGVGYIDALQVPFTTSSFSCNGYEDNINECRYQTIQNNSCSTNRVVLLGCQSAARLVDGPNCSSEGRVEVYQNGSWGAVCDNSFTTEDATIVCQMLDLEFLEVLDWDVPPTAVSISGAKLKNPWCSGNETDIRYCKHERNSDCIKYAAVKCSDPLNTCPKSSVECGYSSYSAIDCDTTTRQPLQEESTQKTTTLRPTTVSQTTTSSPTTVTRSWVTTLNPITVSPSTHSVVTTESPIKGAIDELLNVDVTADNVDSVSDEIANVTEDSSQFDEEDLQSVTDKLSAIVGFASKQNLTEETVVKVSESVIGAVDNILNIPEATFQTTSSKQVSRNILTTISTLTAAIQNTSTNNFTHRGSNIVLAAVKIDRRKFPLKTAIGGASDDVIDFSANDGAPSAMEGVTSVSLPEAILSSVPSSNQAISVSVFFMTSPKLFQKDRSSPSSTPPSVRQQNGQVEPRSIVASPILSVTVERADIKDLPDNESIVFVFPVNQSLIGDENDAEVTQRCVYWDIDLGEWADEGCRTEKADLEGLVSCRCNHLTSFGVLLDIKGSIISKALDVISRIGCIASIICLIVTLCILLGFSLIGDENDAEVTQRCVYWDIDLGEWADEGCRTEKADLEGLVSCRCNHLTSFGVLLDIKGSIISKALDVISRIGCIASIICLIVTLCILLGFRKLRMEESQQILINLSFALLALYATFIIGIDRPTWGVGCSVVAILLHYFCLASLSWMGVEAFTMYMMFVRVMNTYVPKLLLKCSLVGWGTPLVVVMITAASKWTAYQNVEYCFVLPGYSLYFGLLLPIGLILAFNGIIFSMVIYKLTCGRKTFSKGSAWESKKESIAKARMEAIRRAQNAVAIGTLLGLTWSFGFLAFGGGRFLFNALFAIFNSLQGVFVFLLFGIRQPEVREKLRVAKIRLLHGASYARRRSSDFWTSSSGARMTPRPSDVTSVSMGKRSSFAEAQHSTL